jgi:hypothetical protein
LLDGDDAEIAMWRMEIGAPDAPGVCFHTQVLGQSDEMPFPSSLPVPRLPMFAASPLAALDFVLGELFQTGWPMVAGEASATTAMWRSVQTFRWKQVLSWQLERVNAATGSPWLAVKQAFPDHKIFLEGPE